MENTPSTNPEAWAVPGLTALTHAAVGCGAGLLLAARMDRKVRKVTAIVLFSIGLASTLPLAFGAFSKRWNRPESDRGMRKRLASIREGSGYTEDADLY